MQTNIVVIHADKLQELIAETIKTALTTKKEKPFANLPEWLSRKQTCLILNISLATLDKLVREGKIMKYRNGSIVRFSKSDVINFYQTFQKYQRG